MFARELSPKPSSYSKPSMAVWSGRKWGKGVQLTFWNAVGICDWKLEIDNSVRTALIFASRTRLPWVGLGPMFHVICMPPDGPPDSGKRHSDPCPWRHRSLCCASLRSAARGGSCLTPNAGDQTSEAHRSIPLAHRPLIEMDLNECLSGGFPALMAGDVSTKHADWYSSLITARVLHLRDYANRNLCLISEPDSPTTAPYRNNAIPDVLDIAVVNDLVQQVHLIRFCTQLG
jgi:hypothetical protein